MVFTWVIQWFVDHSGPNCDLDLLFVLCTRNLPLEQ